MTVSAFQMPRPHGGPKAMTVTRIVTFGGPIPVTVGTLEMRRKHEEPKVTTVARMAALRRKKRRQLRGQDRDLQGPHPCDCWHFCEVWAGEGTIPLGGGGRIRSPGPGIYIHISLSLSLSLSLI